MRIVIATGGTGGHVHPALVLAEEFRNMENSVLFIGSSHGPEGEKVAAAGFDFLGIEVRGFDRSSIFNALKALMMLPSAVLKTVRALAVFSPHAVIGVGGYASGPACIAAILKGVPLFLLEQNVYPGLVTRSMSKWARKIYTSFKGSEQWLRGASVVCAGNPARKEFSPREKIRVVGERKKLLVMGGSQGARSINRAMVDALAHLKDLNMEIYHQTGAAAFNEVAGAYEQAMMNGVVKPFFDNIAEIMRSVDLVVSRSGASSCAEIAITGLPALLIPYPGAGGHQKLNAFYLLDEGAAEILEDGELNGEILAERIRKLLTDDEKLMRMSMASLNLARPDAGRSIARDILTNLEAS